jgi:5-formyltetrahydrofolate cyclo-ligase
VERSGPARPRARLTPAYHPAVDVDAKRILRREMRRIRGAVTDQEVRSAAIAGHLAALPALVGPSVVMLFDAVAGEPDLSALADVLTERGVRVVRPDPVATAPQPVDPGLVDVVVVPGVAFTADGRRLGQGGGWYDRLLAGLRADAVSIGVCFAVQVLDDLPVEPHDIGVDVVIHEGGPTLT